ncbi:aspartate aminotransferase family protein [Thiorhodovibrio winogradskyi]|nr:aspartate aminotransferase family protein [Thiorhodovibrio winogradskyi]
MKDTYACPCDESRMYDRFLNPVKAEGMWVWFEGDSEPYLDLVLNYCSVNFGHCYPPILKIVQEAVKEVDQIHSFHSQDKLELSEILASKVGGNKKAYQVYFNIGGSAAVSDALRLCRFASGKRFIIAFEGAFHGVSEAAASVADKRLIAREQYGVPISDFTLSVSFPSQHNDVSVEDTLSKIEQLFAEYDVAGVIIEPIQGAGGFVIPKEQFLPGLSQLCQKHSVNLVVDEIQVGFGRAGSLFVYQQYGVEHPDVVLLSKSIGGGYFPVSAVIARAELFEKVPSRGTAFQTTFNNSSFGLRVANRLMQYVEKEQLFDDVLKRGAVFLEKIQFLSQSPYVNNLRGVGFAIAFDLIDPNSGEPSDLLAKKLMSICLEEHVILYACGVHFNSIKIIPPIVITEREMDVIAERLRLCFDKFHAQIL